VEKATARARARALVEGLSAEERAAQDRAIVASLPTTGTVLGFVPLARWEPNIRAALAGASDLVLPRVHGEQLILHRTSLDALVRDGRFGIWEPPASVPVVDPADIDFVWVPGWAFTAHGERLGKGGGFYDRLLPQMTARRIGIGYREQRWHHVPTEPHDARIHALATGDGLVETPWT